MIEAESTRVIRTSREAVWRHVTRVSDWYRWYPGLHGTTATDSITRSGQQWRSTGQMGRMLYRGDQQVTDYRMLAVLEIQGTRRPWLGTTVTRFSLEPDGPNCQLKVTISAETAYWLVGRFLLGALMRRRLQTEADEVAERLASYVENTMPHH